MKEICPLVALICLAVGSLVSAQPQNRPPGEKPRREVAVTFDDLPASAGNARAISASFCNCRNESAPTRAYTGLATQTLYGAEKTASNEHEAGGFRCYNIRLHSRGFCGR